MSTTFDKPFVFTADLKARWLEALRSGKYVQGKGRLRDKSDRFCCLGVLCDVFDSSRWVNQEYDICGRTHRSSAPHEWNLPRTALEDFNDGTNNSDRYSFTEIADWIEANIPSKDEVTP